MQRSLLMAIDPGYTTGIAIVDFAGDLVYAEASTNFDDVLELILSKKPSIVVMEDFIGAGPRTKEAITVLKCFGKVSGVCWMLKKPLIIQTPQTRIPFVSDAKTLAPKGTIIHVIDAFAHALACLEREANLV